MGSTVRQETVTVVVSSQGSSGQGVGQLSTRVSSNPGGLGTWGEAEGGHQTCYGVSLLLAHTYNNKHCMRDSQLNQLMDMWKVQKSDNKSNLN